MTKKQIQNELSNSDREYLSKEYDDHFLVQKHKRVTARNFGETIALINSFFFDFLKGYNIPCAYVKKTGRNKLSFLKYFEYPFKIKILNAADKRTAKIFSVKVGSSLELPVFEYVYGISSDSIVTESHLLSFNLCNYDELKLMSRLCSKINAIIKSFFERRDEFLVELTCGFGKFEGKIYLVDDLSPLSIKIKENEPDGKLPDPYKLETSAQMKKYSDHLLHIINGD